MDRSLVIIGTGGNALDILDVVDAINARKPTWKVIGLLDDMRDAGSEYLDWKILGPLSEASKQSEVFFITAIGSDRSFRRRGEIITALGIHLERFATLVHPGASVSSRSRLGRGIVVNYGVSIGGNVRIENHVYFGVGSVIGHDAHVGNYCVLAPGSVISGGVEIADSCYVGTCACVRTGQKIATGALVGMGAVVIRDVPAGATVVGNPARPL